MVINLQVIRLTPGKLFKNSELLETQFLIVGSLLNKVHHYLLQLDTEYITLLNTWREDNN